MSQSNGTLQSDKHLHIRTHIQFSCSLTGAINYLTLLVHWMVSMCVYVLHLLIIFHLKFSSYKEQIIFKWRIIKSEYFIASVLTCKRLLTHTPITLVMNAILFFYRSSLFNFIINVVHSENLAKVEFKVKN